MGQPGEQDRALSLLDEAVAAVAGLGVHPLELAALTLDDLNLELDTLAVGSRTLDLDRATRDALLLWTQAGRFAFLNAMRPDKAWSGPQSGYRKVVYERTGSIGRYEVEDTGQLFITFEAAPLTPAQLAEVLARYDVEVAPTPLRAVAS